MDTELSKRMLASYKKLGGINHIEGNVLPSRSGIFVIIKKLRELLFPGYFEKVEIQPETLSDVTRYKLSEVHGLLSSEILNSLKCNYKNPKKAHQTCQTKAIEITDAFLAALPDLRATLKKDVTAIYEGDPASCSEAEIILSYPGFQSITVYRMAHFLHQHAVPLIPRLMTEISHSETGIDIHPGAQIGDYFCIDHGTGIVIGETAVIGKHVKLYQGVTLGALSVTTRGKQAKRHPTLEDHVTVYARTTILGDTTVGHHCVIGGNVWITSDVPAKSKIYLSSDREQIQRNP